MKAVRFIVVLLMVIGSLNWGLVGFFGYNLVGDIFGGMMSMGARVVFALVGVAGLLGIGLLCRHCCKSSCGGGKGSCGCGSDCGCNCRKK
ncbi:MAG: hypothetical protein ACD_16C00094G0003 [uncultured bacterium]|nr:MAG: hypothetical protein ACD_16C00094G0003 [uncultured bacterium]